MTQDKTNLEPNTIVFHNTNADWVMRITADRRIEVNEGVEVNEAAQKVLDAMQQLLTNGLDKVIAAEREACAEICDDQASGAYWEGADACASRIRKRGQA